MASEVEPEAAASAAPGARGRPRWLMLVPFTILLGVFFLIHRYFWLRLFDAPAWDGTSGGSAAGAGMAVLTALGLAVPVGAIAWRLRPGPWSARMAWVGFTWLGVALYVLIGLAVTEPWSAGAARETALGVVGAAAALGALGLWGAARTPVVGTVRAEIAGLPAAFEGYRIAVVSDIHIGPTLGAEFARAIAAQVNVLGADAIAVVGDVVDGTVADIGRACAPLAEMRAPDGVFFVTGNHEYYVDATAWKAFWRGHGWRVLENENVTLRRGDGALVVAGVEDVSARMFGGVADVAVAVAPAAGQAHPGPVVLLAHRPTDARPAAKLGVDLVLSGHTHGGQMAPLQVFWRLVHPVVRGTRRMGPAKRTLAWVGQGTGYWGAPLRVGTRAEIGLITLTRAADR